MGSAREACFPLPMRLRRRPTWLLVRGRCGVRSAGAVTGSGVAPIGVLLGGPERHWSDKSDVQHAPGSRGPPQIKNKTPSRRRPTTDKKSLTRHLWAPSTSYPTRILPFRRFDRCRWIILEYEEPCARKEALRRQARFSMDTGSTGQARGRTIRHDTQIRQPLLVM